ncbi:MAG TPA: hypothetical protein VNS12_10570 [Pelagibacterium sp.]|uniref:hypothetical protein n=1 Tax=Pelagibacterium sp. TaxID=1967288 RepID=UPI002D040D09|nr:hypothetical protein [Pelagibacterium sp.]HWJ88504.1 hypothetical protein [Pelagibacterium sp.]
MGKVYNNPATGHIFVEGSGGETRWSSEFPPVNLLPEADWVDTSLSVAFPDFSKFVNYSHNRWFNPPSWPGTGPWRPSTSQDTCVSLTMIEPENRVLGPTTIGTIPAGANYIDVRVRLNRTKAPYNFRDQGVPPLIPNEWVSLPGGSCLVEATEIWRRSFDIVLTGNEVQLIRRQSVIDPGPEPTTGTPPQRNGWLPRSGAGSDPWGQSSYQGWGWISGNNFAGTYRKGHPAALIQHKPPSANGGLGGDTPQYGGKHPRRFNACSINNSAHDFSSTYTGQIVIRPGYLRA